LAKDFSMRFWPLFPKTSQKQLPHTIISPSPASRFLNKVALGATLTPGSSWAIKKEECCTELAGAGFHVYSSQCRFSTANFGLAASAALAESKVV